MDLSDTIVPRSDQINSDDLMSGPVTVTIEKVTRGGDEQPVDIHLVEFPGRAFRPSKSMRRVLVMAWGKESSVYVGRRLTLYRDPEITFGRDKVGGIRISHLSHIDKRLVVALTVTRGKRTPFAVQPLPDSTPSTVREVPPGGVTDEQLKRLGALMKDAGLTGRDEALAFVAEAIGRDVASRDDLTEAEAQAVIARLEENDDGELPVHKFLYGEDTDVCAQCGEPEDADIHGGRA